MLYCLSHSLPQGYCYGIKFRKKEIVVVMEELWWHMFVNSSNSSVIWRLRQEDPVFKASRLQ
jgi:hypothetical protein